MNIFRHQYMRDMVSVGRTVTMGCAVIIFTTGCAAGSKSSTAPQGSIAAVVRADQHGLEVAATTTDQVRDEILTTPTAFDVAFADDEYSWERARFFLENYVGGSAGHTAVVTKIVGTQWSLESNPAMGKYRYAVSKDARDGVFAYTVICEAGAAGDPGQAALNAGNFARFIRDGQLEVSLLKLQ